MNNQMKAWAEKEARLAQSRNRMCLAGASREEALVEYAGEQARHNKAYDGIAKQRAGRGVVSSLR